MYHAYFFIIIVFGNTMDLNHRPAADVILELFDVCLSLALRVTSTEKTLMTKPITADLYRHKF